MRWLLTVQGGGIAKRCEAAGGDKVEFGQYILDLWKKIGYSPGELEHAAAYDDHGEDQDEVEVSSPKAVAGFTPVKVVSEPEKFAGVTVKQFPKGTDDGDIMEFLVSSGLPESCKESVVIKANGYVTLNDLENSVCRKLIENIHNKNNFGRKLYCNGIIPLTPEKKDSAPATDTCPPGSEPPGQTSPPPALSAPPAIGTAACTSTQADTITVAQGTGNLSVSATSMSSSLIASALPSSDIFLTPISLYSLKFLQFLTLIYNRICLTLS